MEPERDGDVSGLTQLIQRLVALEPGTPQAEQEQHAIESLLMTALRAGGDAGEKLVESLAGDGFALKRLDLLPWMWQVGVPKPRVLEIWFMGKDRPIVAALSYRIGKARHSKAERDAAKLQAAFYSRYEKLPVEGPGRKSLSPADRLILLVGEFEADVNNGGFGQYLANKGAERARDALAGLRTIGARRTAHWLSAALEAGGKDEVLRRLDDDFLERPEDLPAKTMRHLART